MPTRQNAREHRGSTEVTEGEHRMLSHHRVSEMSGALFFGHLRPEVADTLDEVLRDERRHIDVVHRSLRDLEPVYGADTVRATLARHASVDQEIYAAALSDHGGGDL